MNRDVENTSSDPYEILAILEITATLPGWSSNGAAQQKSAHAHQVVYTRGALVYESRKARIMCGRSSWYVLFQPALLLYFILLLSSPISQPIGLRVLC